MVSGRSRRRGEGASGPRQRVGSRHGQPYVGVAGQDCGRARSRGRRSSCPACVEDAIAGWRRDCSGEHAYVSPNPWLQRKTDGRIRLAVAHSTINRRLPYIRPKDGLSVLRMPRSLAAALVGASYDSEGPPWELIDQRDRPLKRGVPVCRGQAANPLVVLPRSGAGIVVQRVGWCGYVTMSIPRPSAAAPRRRSFCPSRARWFSFDVAFEGPPVAANSVDRELGSRIGIISHFEAPLP
jgi:hypothetical protein